jgi:deoxyribonuclease-4
MKLRIGSHVSMSAPNYFLGSVKEALSYQANCLMIYTGAPQNTLRTNLDRLLISEGLALLAGNGLSGKDVFVHAPYIVNLANDDLEKREFGIDFLTKEVNRTQAFNANVLIMHPGSAVNCTKEVAINNIATSINTILANTNNTDVKIALETMSGKGNEVGMNFNELAQIIALIDDKSRIGVCLDTCHIFDAGYDIVNNYQQVINEFDQIIGLDKLLVIHVNDSKNHLGSKKDRHANLGDGQIGLVALMQVFNDQRFEKIAKLLETPYIDGQPPYQKEIALVTKNLIKS